MRLLKPYAGDNVADVCRRAYFEVMKGKEPVIINFNEVTIIFTNDDKGYNHPNSDIDKVGLEWTWGMNIKELYDSSKQTMRDEKDE